MVGVRVDAYRWAFARIHTTLWLFGISFMIYACDRITIVGVSTSQTHTNTIKMQLISTKEERKNIKFHIIRHRNGNTIYRGGSNSNRTHKLHSYFCFYFFCMNEMTHSASHCTENINGRSIRFHGIYCLTQIAALFSVDFLLLLFFLVISFRIRCRDFYFLFSSDETIHHTNTSRSSNGKKKTNKKKNRKHNWFWFICFCISFSYVERIRRKTHRRHTEPISMRFRWISSRVDNTMGF